MTSKTTATAATALAGATGIALLSGCGITIGSASTSGLGRDASKATIIVTPGEIEGKAAVDSPITIVAQNGHLVQVDVVGPKGETVAGKINPEQSAWTSGIKALAFGASYTIKARALDIEGRLADMSTELNTVSPDKMFSGQLVNFYPGDKVGVGMPVRIEFNKPIAKPLRVEKHLQIRANKPVVGAWSWDSDKTAVTFRPQTYWPGNTNVKVSARLRGANAGAGMYGSKDLLFKFSTGKARVWRVDAEEHMLDVKEANAAGKYKTVKTIPVTTGKRGFETREGIVVMMAKEGTVVMDAASGGTSTSSSEYYRLTVQDSIRITPSGQYMHAAPWSVGAQGRANTSHGCIGMSSSNAQWMWENSSVGDVVEILHTGRKQELDNGIADWNIPWIKWLAKSRIGAQEIGPGAPDTIPAPPDTTPGTVVGPAPMSSKHPYSSGTG